MFKPKTIYGQTSTYNNEVWRLKKKAKPSNDVYKTMFLTYSVD